MIALFDSPLWIVVGGFILLGIFLSCLVPRSPRGIEQHPSCYGSAPGPQAQAENDCESCQWQFACFNNRRGEMTQGRNA